MIESFRELLEAFSQWAIPLVMLLIVVWARVKGVAMYESFITGAKEGFEVAVKIIPYLVAILVIIKVFLASGIFADLKFALAWALEGVGMPQAAEGLDLLPLALTRPLSGSGARGVLAELYLSKGPDSFLGETATLMMGSTETTFYILAVYYGSVQVKKFRHTLPACLIADAAGMIAAVAIGVLLYSGLQ